MHAEHHLTRKSDKLRSMVAMLIAVGTFSVMDTIMKLLAAHYPALQVAAARPHPGPH